MKKTINSPMFRAIYRAQRGLCFYCDKKLLSSDGRNDDLTLDHFIPLAKGGANHHSNYVLACRGCNSYKGDELPKSKYKRKKYMLDRYIKANRKNIFKMSFIETKSYFDLKRTTHLPKDLINAE